MSAMKRMWTRIVFAMKGQKAIGEYYRPILSSIHIAGAQIHTATEPIFGALQLSSETLDETPPPTLDRSIRIFPDFYDSDDLTRKAIWEIILAVRPDYVIETGVANGLSTQTILGALDHNGHGELYSFDVDPRTEQSVPFHLRSRWVYRTINSVSPMRDLTEAVTPLAGRVSVWFHDSDHSYSWQKAEYELATSVLRQGGILVSDDIDGTEAFADFCRDHPDWSATALFDTRKVCGFARKPGT